MGIENLPRGYEQPPDDGPAESAPEAEVSPYTLEIESVIGDRTISSINSSLFESGRKRFVYAFTEPTNPNEKPGFVKLGRKDQLFEPPDSVSVYMKREAQALQVAQSLGIPTTNIIHPYTETPNGYGLLHIEALSTEDGTALPSPELTAGAPAEYGAWIAETLAQHCAHELPPHIDSKEFRRVDERNESLEAFLQTWSSDIEAVKLSLSSEQSAVILPLIETAQSEVSPLLRAAEEDHKEYFVHNDVTPANTFFNEKEKTAMLLDFERAGTTHNKVLAYITDIGTFYARAWPNQSMQQTFLKTLIDKTSPAAIDDEYVKLKAAMIFSSTFLAKWAVEPNHPERPMYESLIGNLEENVRFLDEVYEQKKNESSTA